MEYLVAQGADIDACDFHGRTAYRMAEGSKQSFQFQSWPETAALLAELGADTQLGIPGTVRERLRDVPATSEPCSRSQGKTNMATSAFDAPTFEVAKISYTALGVFFVWASWGKGRLSVRYLNSILAQRLSKNQLLLVEFLVTMGSGVIFAITFVEPQTAKQAIVAGMGWTSLVAKPTEPSVLAKPRSTPP